MRPPGEKDRRMAWRLPTQIDILPEVPASLLHYLSRRVPGFPFSPPFACVTLCSSFLFLLPLPVVGLLGTNNTLNQTHIAHHGEAVSGAPREIPSVCNLVRVYHGLSAVRVCLPFLPPVHVASPRVRVLTYLSIADTTKVSWIQIQ